MEAEAVLSGDLQIVSDAGSVQENGNRAAYPAGIEKTEAFQFLTSLAHRKTGAIPASLLARHVLGVTADADWPVRRAAMDAVLRRCSFGKQDRLELASAPRGVFGVYRTRRAGSSQRPYATLLASIDPIRGSCDCPDYLRNSLGVCKHLLTIVESLAKNKRRFKSAVGAGGAGQNGSVRLTWDPVRPLRAEGDWMSRVQLLGTRGAGVNGADPLGRLARRWFRRQADGGLVLAHTYADQPERRLALAKDLHLAAGAGGRGARRWQTSEPAVQALLTAEVNRLQRVVDVRAAVPETERALRKMKRRLYPYQLEGVARLLASGRLLLADDMGLGKTAQAIGACHALWAVGRVKRGLLIVPASLKPQWLREWQSFTDAPAAVVEGGAAERRSIYRDTRSGFLVANYEQVLRDLEAMHAWQPDIVVLDEAQRIKNWATKTSAYVKRLQPAYRLVLTGTPMENRLEELASLLDWVDDQALEPKWRLVPWHAVAADGSRGVIGARNLDTLRRRLAPCMIRRVRQEVLRQLPPRTDTIVPVPITDEQAQRHDELDQPIAQLLRIAQRRPLKQKEFLRLMSLLTAQRIIANGLAQADFAGVWPQIAGATRPEGALLGSLSSPKLLELREIVSQVALQQGRKLVVFSQWRRMLTLASWAIADLLADNGLRSAFFTGKEGQKRRTHNIVDFHDDPSTRVLFLSDAGGVGLNLQHAASCCVNIELPWNPAVLEQRIGRIYRLGQKRPIDVYNLVTEDSIEARIAGLVADKRALFRGLFDGDSDEVSFDRSGSFLSRLEQIVEPAPEPDLPDDADGGQEGETPLARELDEIISASDESQDAELAAAPPQRDAPAVDVPSAPLPAPEVRNLFAQLQIRPRDGGGMVIEAPPQAASTLAALFEGMAQMLRTAAPEGE